MTRRVVLQAMRGLSSLQPRPLARSCGAWWPIHIRRAAASDSASESHRVRGTTRLADLSGLGPKRFYKEVSVATTTGNNLEGQGGWTVHLDHRGAVKTPAGGIMCLPTEELALLIAQEFDEQIDRLRPALMPMYRLASTALDLVPQYRQRMLQSILRVAETDTVCYRVDHPTSLAEAQKIQWDPILEYLASTYAMRFVTTTSLAPAQQPQATLNKVEELVSEGKMGSFSIAAMDLATSTAKSVAIALGLRDGFLSSDNGIKATLCDEDYQTGIWGTVEGGHDIDRAEVSVRLSSAAVVFRLAEKYPDRNL